MRLSPAPDVVGAITSVLGAIAEPGDRVVLTTPVYHPFLAVLEEARCELAEAPLVEAAAERIARAVGRA